MASDARRIADVLGRIQQTRRGMHSFSGWSWKAAGYHYDPDQGAHERLEKLMKELDAALGDQPVTDETAPE